jgi:chemotaxis-related protein WspB
MVALLFEIDGQRYGLDFTQVLKVLPSVRLRRLPGVPEYVAGVFQYRGAMVPVIDLSRLIKGRPSVAFLSTRIILVRYSRPGGQERVLGLLAERATESLDTGSAALQSSGVAAPEAPYLGGLSATGDGIIQYCKVEQLLSEELRNRLFVEE